ncbi:MAG: sigma-54-dependent Fis family transcriptional regulator [Sedimentisphaerales bacterium]|nr:sigma-54-dependent Fis family transcriptional regulator [Sedimentisphaerales bacterium]
MPKNDCVILVVDDEKDHADVLVEALDGQCGLALCAYSAKQAQDIINENDIDLLITDLNLGSQINGIDLLKHAKQKNRQTSVILITAYATIDTCKEAIKLGASDYFVKPIDIDQLRTTVSNLLPKKYPVGTDDFVFEGMPSRSRTMQNAFNILKRVAPTNISVLIEGASGTGKELTARAIHNNSKRKDKAFRPINCAGFSETLLESELFGHVKGAFTGADADRKGLFQVADKGTLFLDEIGDMPQKMQAKLLRVLEDGVIIPVGSTKPIVVDVRIISATNHNLTKLVDEQKFRQDLYFRIKGVSITLPPLKQRAEDIPELFGYFLKEACGEVGRNITRITDSALAILVGYDWPGNIRQLKNAVKTMVVMCDRDTLDVRDIPPEIHLVKRLSGHVESSPAVSDFTGRSLNDVERQHIIDTLALTDGNRSEAAKILGIGERTLYRKIKEYDL